MGSGGGHGFLGTGAGQAALFSNPLTLPAGIINSTMIQPQNIAKDQARDSMKNLSETQNSAAAALQTQIAQQPKVTQPDNFLAMKSKALAALRLGFASTSTGASGQASILPTGLKSKLGS